MVEVSQVPYWLILTRGIGHGYRGCTEAPHCGEVAAERDALLARVADLEKEAARLRAVLVACRLDPDRCEKFPGGEQCGLRAGHEGKCAWLRGD
jgi:hypothetical protein